MTYSKKAYPYIILTLIIIVAVVSSLSFWDNKDRCSKSLSGIEKGLSEFGATFYTPNPEDKSITPLVYIESCKKPINLLIADDSKDLILNVLKNSPPDRHGGTQFKAVVTVYAVNSHHQPYLFLIRWSRPQQKNIPQR
ncbi:MULTISPECIES: hypothetical protein [Novosphingobium]|uniref:hypothetical protein n=1 Tax=Novosphingobium TaxID=165696 RepID=UPI0022F29964|nr:hypothetical protein [Novosphingobium resinovorum]